MSVIYELKRQKGLIDLPEKFLAGHLYDYCLCNLEFPQDSSIQYPYPLVKVKFRVSPTGRPDWIEIIKPYSTPYDSAALKVVRNMPNWRPHTRKGEYVPVLVVVAFRFNPDEKAKRCPQITS